VSALLACTIDETVCIFYQQSLSHHQKFGINNALTYTFTREVLQRREIRSIFYGLHSLDAPPTVDDYKFRMKFLPKPVKQRVVFNPFIAPLLQPLSHSLVKAIIKILPENAHFAKAEGMIRFYLQGKRPLVEQDWPEVLKKEKESILALAGK
jgi:hypothetical protein